MRMPLSCALLAVALAACVGSPTAPAAAPADAVRDLAADSADSFVTTSAVEETCEELENGGTLGSGNRACPDEP